MVNNLLIHISGSQGSGKTTLGEKLKQIFDDNIYMEDLDILFSKFGGQSEIKDYQQYIYNYISGHNDKPLILVGLDADLCLGPTDNPKLEGYDIPTEHKYYIDIDEDENLRQWFFRQVGKLNGRMEWFWSEYEKDNKKTQDKLFRYVDIDGRKKNIKECIKLYESRNYKFLDRDIILEKCKKLINSSILTKTMYLTINKIKVGECKLDFETDNTVFLWNVQIYQKYRGNGYCNKLVKKVIELSKQKKITKIYLHVKHDNNSAIKCYENNKFKIIKKNYEDKKLFGYTMEHLLII
jgi:N-acetylglutamate synthase-like GNAT family acetyltransferase